MVRLLGATTLIAVFGGLSCAQTTGDTPPALIYRSEPEYSQEATRARVQSTVILSVIIGEDGRARDIQIKQGAGFGLDEKAIESMDKWRFKPATHDGNPVPFPANIEMNFSVLVRNDTEDHSGQRARLNFTLPPDTTRPELIVGKLPGNPKAPGDQALRIHLKVDSSGVPKDVTVLESNDAVWEKLVTRVVQTWRFRPASLSGVAVVVEGELELEHSSPPEAAEPVILEHDVPENDDTDAPATRHAPAPLRISGIIPRSNHTATRLANGTVLLTGGEGTADHHELASAQIFDWATRSIVNTGNMLTARQNHTATLLPNGTVLIAGGEAAEHPLAAVEIFDPSTGKFSSTANLHEARYAQAAAPLPDGRVLICGGTGIAGKPLISAEIYDPRTKTFLRAGNMTAPRAYLSAVTMKDGTVLLAGGVGATAEIFDAKTGVFKSLGRMGLQQNGTSVDKSRPSAVLLDNGQILVTSAAGAEIFDSVTNAFHTIGPMATAHTETVDALLKSGRALITGGPMQTEIFDPKAGTFSAGPNLNGPHTGHTVTLLEDGSVFVAGESAELLLMQ